MSTIGAAAARMPTWVSPLDMEAGLRAQGLLTQAAGSGWANEIFLPILEAMGWKGDARELADLLAIHTTPLHWNDVMNLLRMLGYQCSAIQAPPELLTEQQLPCLLVPDSGAAPWIVLEKNADGWMGYSAADQTVQAMPPMPHAASLWHITAEEQSDDDQRGPWFPRMLRRFRGQFRDVLFLGFLVNLFALSVPVFTMLVYDRVIAGHNLSTLYYLLGGVGIALLAEGVFRWLRARSLSWFGVRANHLIVLAMFQRLLAIEPLAIERASPAAQIVRAKAMESIRDFLTGQGFILFIEFPFLPLLILVLLVLTPPMALACVGTAILLGILLATQLRAVRAAAQRSARAMSERQRDVLEIFAKLETLRLNGLSDPLYDRFRLSNSKAINHAGEVTWRMQIIEHLVLSISMLGGLVALLLGVECVWAGSLTPGGLIAGMIIAWRIVMPMQQLAAIAPRLEQVNGAVMQLEQLLAMPPERAAPRETASAQRLRGQVELVNVAMRYPRQMDAVFAGLSLSVAAGELVTISGANGSGKSSVLKLINGMYKQASGSLRLDGIDIRQLDPLGLRRGITYIPQATNMFSGTVFENLTVAAPFADSDRVMEALEQADALHEIMELPDGLSTLLGPNGMQLPQALAFKLGLARAYVDIKPLVLCDELPYALLNTHAGVQFRDQLARLKGQHTVFLVAHTADLVQLADQAVFLRVNRRPVVGKPTDILPLMLEQPYGTFL